MDRSHDGAIARKPTKRVWTRERTQAVVRLTADEVRMLKGLVRHLRVSQNATLVRALRDLHDREMGRKAA